MRRFFISPESEITRELLLPEQESHHLVTVLRLAAGAELQLLDGRGNRYDARILQPGKRVLLEICLSHFTPPDPVPLMVCQSLLKGQKMELLVQKCTELGVREFTPFYSSRCQFKKNELDKVTNKYERWRRIVEEACKQCDNPWAMQLNPLISYDEVLEQYPAECRKILFWEEQTQDKSLHSQPLERPVHSLQLVFGPEGGFPEEEVVQAGDDGQFLVLSLGARVLKAETANIAGVAIVQHLLGNM